MSGRPDPEEWSGEECGLQFPDGTPLLLAGTLQAGARDASTGIRPASGLTALHVIVASGGYVAAACDSRIIIDATTTISAADARPGGRCRRPACAALFGTARSSARPPAPPAAVPGPSVFRCTECGHGGSLRAWAHVNIHGDLAPDGHIEWPDYEDDAFWPVIEEWVTCKIHGEDFIEKLAGGQYTSHIDTAAGRYAAAPAASTGGRR